jgi:8-oxo-dGTP diphosphatase
MAMPDFILLSNPAQTSHKGRKARKERKMSNARQSAVAKTRAIDRSHESDTSVIEVAAGIVCRDGKILITQRRSQDHLGDLWEFPGGKREAEETFENCLRRELREELGIEVVVGDLVETVTHQYPEQTVHLKFYRCVWVRNEPQAIGCQAFAWVGTPQLADYSFPAADTQLLEKLRNHKLP